MKRYPRAYYIGGFGVGTGVPRVKIVGYVAEIAHPNVLRFRVKVTSKNAYGYRFGECFDTYALNLFDKISFRQGPKLFSSGKQWLVEAKEIYHL